ncbi:MAG: hypothetical protein LCH26_05190 [Proteobacteria bacterium]|nr:hypothetical protein [Pseudomonadota bacterium]
MITENPTPLVALEAKASGGAQTEAFVTRDAKQEELAHPAENNEMAQAEEGLKEKDAEVALNAEVGHTNYLSFFISMFY